MDIFSTESKLVMYVQGNVISDKFFMMNYRKKAIEEIKKYWPHEIINLYKDG